jgi:general secretion pathway protein B
MSFILDALKKSEIERQRQTIPGLMDSRPTAPRPRFPLWAIALVVLLGVNLVVLGIVLTRSGSTPLRRALDRPSAVQEPPAATTPPALAAATASPPDAQAASATPSSSAAASPQDHFSPMDPAPMYAPEIPVEGSAAAHHPPSSGAAAHHASHLPDPVLTEDDDKGEVLPSISEINLSGRQALPEMHLDVHVFATKPADRFVYINMRKYREGATLAEGPILERIRRDGVVLSYQGLRFVLPRQQ